MKKFLNKILKTALPVLLGLLILYMIYDDFDFSRLWSDFQNMNLFWFLLSTFFGIMSHVIRGWRWKLSLAPLGYNPNTSVSVYAIFIAYAANLVIPRVGEVSRCVVLERNSSVPFAQSLGTVVTERLLDTVMVVLITLVAVALQWPVFVKFVTSAGIASPAGGYSVSTWAVVLPSAVAFVVLLCLLLKKSLFSAFLLFL